MEVSASIRRFALVIAIAHSSLQVFAVSGTKAVDPETPNQPPRVLLIGDSIAANYAPFVRKLLEGKANVIRIPINGGPTTNGLKFIDEWLGNDKWDVIHFNWGLHDWCLVDLVLNDTGTREV